MRDDHSHPTAAPARDLHVCVACARSFVIPNAILSIVPGARDYVMELRCMSCGWTGVGTYDEDTMEAFDRELDRTQGEVRQAADVMSVLNMVEDIDVFARALQDDLILPEDF